MCIERHWFAFCIGKVYTSRDHDIIIIVIMTCGEHVYNILPIHYHPINVLHCILHLRTYAVCVDLSEAAAKRRQSV